MLAYYILCGVEMKVLELAIIAAIGLAIIAVPVCLAETAGSNVTQGELPEFISAALSNPKVLIAVLIQFLLGLGLGYFSVKVIKYILALLGILVLGSVLSVWSLGGSIDEFLTKIGAEAQKVLPLIKSIMATLGILTVGPVAIGFIIGIIAGSLKK